MISLKTYFMGNCGIAELKCLPYNPPPGGSLATFVAGQSVSFTPDLLMRFINQRAEIEKFGLVFASPVLGPLCSQSQAREVLLAAGFQDLMGFRNPYHTWAEEDERSVASIMVLVMPYCHDVTQQLINIAADNAPKRLSAG